MFNVACVFYLTVAVITVSIRRLLQMHPNDTPVPVPYTSKLGTPLVAGQSLSVHGTINADANR